MKKPFLFAIIHKLDRALISLKELFENYLYNFFFFHFQVVLAKYYIEILSIGKDSTDGRKLLNYRAPKNAKQVQHLLRERHCRI